jgi:hypothetical protein
LDDLGLRSQAALLITATLVTPGNFGVARWLVVPPDEDSPEYKGAAVSKQLADVVKTVSSAMGAKDEPEGGTVR